MLIWGKSTKATAKFVRFTAKYENFFRASDNFLAFTSKGVILVHVTQV